MPSKPRVSDDRLETLQHIATEIRTRGSVTRDIYEFADLVEDLVEARVAKLAWRPIAEIHEDFCPCIIWDTAEPSEYLLLDHVDEWNLLSVDAAHTHFISLKSIFRRGFDPAIDAAIAQQKEQS